LLPQNSSKIKWKETLNQLSVVIFFTFLQPSKVLTKTKFYSFFVAVRKVLSYNSLKIKNVFLVITSTLRNRPNSDQTVSAYYKIDFFSDFKAIF
jgi:hypothetical protein